MGRFDRNRNSGRRDSQVTMHSAVCDACGRECKVPFKPSGDKPIYCSNCFEKQGGGSSDRREKREYRDDRGSRDKEMFSAICDECGKECQVPFKPSSDKPIYCSRCFENKGNTHSGHTNNNKQNEQLDLIVSKLDLILSALEKQSVKKEVIKKEPVKKAVVKKETTKKEPAKKKSVKKAKKE